MAIMVDILNHIARSSCTMQCQNNKTGDKDGFLDGIRDSMSSHILSIFTAFDEGSLATPLLNDGFELSSIAKKL